MSETISATELHHSMGHYSDVIPIHSTIVSGAVNKVHASPSHTMASAPDFKLAKP